jgi:hypothetical protein
MEVQFILHSLGYDDLRSSFDRQGQRLIFYDKDNAQDELLGIIFTAIEDNLEILSAELRLQIEQ